MAVTDPTIISHFTSIRLDTGVNSINFPDEDLLSVYNRARRKIINRIRKLDRDYYYTEWTDDLVKDQIEYTLPKYRTYTVGSTTYVVPKCLEVIQIGVKTGIDGDFVMRDPISIRNPSNIERMRKYRYGFSVLDNSIFIFPVASEDIAGGFKIYGIYEPPDLTQSSTEADIAVPDYELLIQETKIHVCEIHELAEKMKDARNEAERLWDVYNDNFIRQKGPYLTAEPDYSGLH